MDKIIIYQVLPRLYGNRNTTNKPNGTLNENGCGKLNDFSSKELKEIKKKGITHIWYTGVIRHATKTDYSSYGIPRCHPAVVKGQAGSPYAISDYYDIDPDLAVDVTKRMLEFESLVERTHKQGMKVIIDFVPNHVARQYKSLFQPKGIKGLGDDDDTTQGFSPQNNFYYCPGEQFSPYFDLYSGETEPYIEHPAKATGNDHFDSRPGINDWYETVKLNYGVDYYAGGIGFFNPIPDTWSKMLDILRFWASKGVDAFRCDMAEMVPPAFWSWALGKLKSEYPEVKIIGEVYNPSLYRTYISCGFDYLYDKVGMYDTLRSIVCGYNSASSITGVWQATDDIADHMLYFLENHDEQRVASTFFASCPFKAVPALAVSLLLRRNPFMLFEGEEYGENGMDAEGFSGSDGRTTIFDYWSLDTLCRAAKFQLTEEEQRLADIHTRLIDIARKEKAVSEGEFFDLMYVNPASPSFNPFRHYAFIRRAGKTMLLVVANFDDYEAEVSVTIPAHAFDYLKIPEGIHTATELLCGTRQDISLKKDSQVLVFTPSYGVSIYKITF